MVSITRSWDRASGKVGFGPALPPFTSKIPSFPPNQAIAYVLRLQSELGATAGGTSAESFSGRGAGCAL